MSPSTATAPRRSADKRRSGSTAARRRQRAVRRRRGLLVLAVAAACAIGVVLAMPLFRKAVNEFTLPLSYSDVIRQQAAQKHLDPALVAGVIYAETKFDARTSAAGAEGLMQILPQTAEFLAHRSGATNFRTSDLSTPEVNIAYGSYYLRYLLDEYDNNKVEALAAYNGGEANVTRWVNEHGHKLTVAQIPFAETRDYVKRVLSAERSYRHAYPSELGYR
ncbi:MAG TPA: lytic transglycosylase domain-containing protein [Solirubrobacteraceae bacterium]|jgi:soluble lytic murein transglycosylase